MTTTYIHTRGGDPIKEFLLDATTSLFVGIKEVAKLPVLVGWALGLILLTTIGLLYTILFYIPVLLARKTTRPKVQKILDNINQIPQRTAMEILLHTEQIRKKLDHAVEVGSGYFVFMPIIYEMRIGAKDLKEAEDALFKKAYPDFDREVSSSDKNQSKEIFRDWEEDWKDEKMDVYNDQA